MIVLDAETVDWIELRARQELDLDWASFEKLSTQKKVPLQQLEMYRSRRYRHKVREMYMKATFFMARVERKQLIEARGDNLVSRSSVYG